LSILFDHDDIIMHYASLIMLSFWFIPSLVAYCKSVMAYNWAMAHRLKKIVVVIVSLCVRICS